MYTHGQNYGQSPDKFSVHDLNLKVTKRAKTCIYEIFGPYVTSVQENCWDSA